MQASANLERTLIARQLLRMRAISARPRPPLRAEQRSVRVFVASNADDTAAECDMLTSRVRPADNSRKLRLHTIGYCRRQFGCTGVADSECSRRGVRLCDHARRRTDRVVMLVDMRQYACRSTVRIPSVDNRYSRGWTAQVNC